MCAYVINVMVVLIIFPVILQTDINLGMPRLQSNFSLRLKSVNLSAHFDNGLYKQTDVLDKCRFGAVKAAKQCQFNFVMVLRC